MRIFSACFEALLLPVAVAGDVADAMRGEEPGLTKTRNQIRFVEDLLRR